MESVNDIARKKTKMEQSQEDNANEESNKTKDSGVDYAKLAASYAKSQADSSDSPASKVGGLATQLGLQGLDAKKGSMLASASPYALAAGGGLMAYGAIQDKKQKEKIAKYNAEIDRLNRENNAMGMLANIAQNFKSL